MPARRECPRVAARRMNPAQDLPDDELARAAATGERDAFEALVTRYGASVAAVVERQVGDPHTALDLAQEVWLKVFRAIDRYRPGGTFRSWLFSITFNHLRDAMRRQQRSRMVQMDELTPIPASPDPLEESAERSAIRRALRQVPEPYRAAVTLVDVLEFTYEEAAGALECALGTVKSRVNRGRFLFRDNYNRQGGGEGGGKRGARPVTYDHEAKS